MLDAARCNVVRFRGGSFMLSGQSLIPVLLCLAVANGCSGVLDDMTRTLIHEPLQYNVEAERTHDEKSFLELAEPAWREFESRHEGLFSHDFALGFRDGFVDHLLIGGSGEPPVIPPRAYWSGKLDWMHRNASVQDWYEGFRAGASMAQEQGLREQIVVPSAHLGFPVEREEPETRTFRFDSPNDKNKVEELPTPRVSSLSARRHGRE